LAMLRAAGLLPDAAGARGLGGPVKAGGAALGGPAPEAVVVDPAMHIVSNC
jgi:hypothetical protein